MAEEPQPSTIHEGAATPDVDDEPTFSTGKSAEDRKAAAALSSVSAARVDDDEDDSARGGTTGVNVNLEALGRAMKNLNLASSSSSAASASASSTLAAKDGGAGVGSAAAAADASSAKREAEEAERIRRKGIKVDAGDVNLLVEELELSKAKATDLLKTHDGDLERAVRAFVTASA